MAKVIQIRNVPDALHACLKARAAKQGMSLSAYLLREIKSIAEIPTLDELSERIRLRTPVNLWIQPFQIIR